MSRLIGWGTAAWLLTACLLTGYALAGNEGQADLDKATESKLNVRTFSDLGEVIRLCESALAKGLDKENAVLAKELLVSTRIERAKVAAKRILESSPPDPNWPQFRQFALEDLDKAAKLNPQQPEALFLIAQLNLLPGGDEKRAAKSLDDAIRLSENEPLLHAQALVVRAGLQKNADKKLTDLSAAIRAAPGNLAALRERASVYAEQDKLDLALADLKAVLELEPEHVPTLEDQAIALARLKKYDEALKTIEKARKLAPKSAGPLVQKARVHAMQSNMKAALDDLAEALATEPTSLAALLLRATIYQQMDQTEEALADVDRLLELRPGLPMAVRLRTLLLAGEGKYSEAIQQLEDLLKRKPDDVESQMQMAIFCSADRKPQKAIEIYTAILTRHPDNWEALRGRGDTLLTTGKHAEAIADFEKALKMRPKDSGVLNNLAWVLATSPNDKLRNGKRAVELAKLGCEVTKYEQAHILSTLAAAYAETGDFKSAMKWSQKAVEKGQDDQKETLGKELASYRAGKPWRELLLEPEPPKPERFRPKKAAAPKQEPKTPDEKGKTPEPPKDKATKEKAAPKDTKKPEPVKQPAQPGKEKPAGK